MLQNKKNILITGIFVIIIGIYFQFIYIPKAKEVKQLSAENKKIISGIDEVYNFIGGQANLKENIIKMRAKVKEFEEAFPSEKEVSDIIRQLNEEARRFRVDMVSIKPENLQIYRDSSGAEVKLLDCFCKSMLIHLDVEARYQHLGEFLMNLEMDKRPLITVMRVDIKKDENITPKIKAEIDINACLLGK